MVVENEVKLDPPAKKGTVSYSLSLEDVWVEKVCPEIVIIAGAICKELTYKPVHRSDWMGSDHHGGDHTQYVRIPFQCLIEREDANEGDPFHIVGADIICEVFAREEDFGYEQHHVVAHKFVEKEIVKVCIRKGYS